MALIKLCSGIYGNFIHSRNMSEGWEWGGGVEKWRRAKWQRHREGREGICTLFIGNRRVTSSSSSWSDTGSGAKTLTQWTVISQFLCSVQEEVQFVRCYIHSNVTGCVAIINMQWFINDKTHQWLIIEIFLTKWNISDIQRAHYLFIPKLSCLHQCCRSFTIKQFRHNIIID